MTKTNIEHDQFVIQRQRCVVSDKKSPTHYVCILVEQARALGLDVQRILEQTGIPPALANDPGQWIDNDLLTRLVKAMWAETNDETFGLGPVPLKIGTWALACEFMITADTLGELLRKGERILSFLAPHTAGLVVQQEGDSVALLPQVYIGERDPEHFLVEFMSVLWHRFPSWAIDERIPVQEGFFSYPPPAHASFYEEFFSCDIAFEQAACGFKFHQSYMKRKINRTQVELNAWLRDSPADLLYVPGREKSIQAQLKGALLARTKDTPRYPAFEALCEDLAMSPQVVRRRLSTEGTSYQQIKDAIRCETAQQLLANPELSIMDIAISTGFSEPAAFSRSFKKWTGESPAHYRSKRQSK